MKKIRSSQASISINSCSELSKTQFFPVSVKFFRDVVSVIEMSQSRPATLIKKDSRTGVFL